MTSWQDRRRRRRPDSENQLTSCASADQRAVRRVAGAGFEPVTSGRDRGTCDDYGVKTVATEFPCSERETKLLPVTGYPLGADPRRLNLDPKWTLVESGRARLNTARCEAQGRVATPRVSEIRSDTPCNNIRNVVSIARLVTHDSEDSRPGRSSKCLRAFAAAGRHRRSRETARNGSDPGS